MSKEIDLDELEVSDTEDIKKSVEEKHEKKKEGKEEDKSPFIAKENSQSDIGVEVEIVVNIDNDWKPQEDIDEHLLTIEQLSQRFLVDIHKKNHLKSGGLSEEVVTKRIQTFGENKLAKAKPPNKLWAFIKEFLGFFSVMLELAGIGCFINYGINKKLENLFLGCALWAVVIISASLNFAQVFKSLKIMGGFDNLVPQKSTVIRGGKQQSVDSTVIAVGDLVRIRPGDKIPADIRLISSSNMKVDNSSLTGESEGVHRNPRPEKDKTTPFIESHNLIFLGTLCLEGEGVGVVVRTGNETVLGKTASLASNVNAGTRIKSQDEAPVQKKKRNIPILSNLYRRFFTSSVQLTVLQKEIQTFVQRVSIIGITVGIIVLIVSIVLGVPYLDSIVFGVGSIVAIVPEGLQLTVTLALTLTASRMAKNNVLVKRLAIVETLGCTSVICSDKTGTLTQNKMTISYMVFNEKIHSANTMAHSIDRPDSDDPNYQVLLRANALCNRATYDASDKTGKAIIGDASETAILRFVSGILNVDQLQAKWPKKIEIPFNSLNKWQLSVHHNLNAFDMSQSVNRNPNASPTVLKRDESKFNMTQSLSTPNPSVQHHPPLGLTQSGTHGIGLSVGAKEGFKHTPILIMKGAPERIMERCSNIYTNGQVKKFDSKTRKGLEGILLELAAEGQRVIGFAQLELDPVKYPPTYVYTTQAPSIDETKEHHEPKSKSSSPVNDYNFPTENLTFLGFMGMYDPPREKVDEAVKICQGAGVRVVMVTGDHPATAKAIAKQIGIIKDKTADELVSEEGISVQDAKVQSNAIVIPGSEIPGLTGEDWDIILKKEQIVFARTSPEQKLQIVSQFQSKGEIVAVTGDGVNDSPALKKADVGVAMGITGSEVAKEAADIVLMDDNFATIVSAIAEGRLIFDNLKKCIAYGLSAKLPEVLPFLFFICLQLPLPISTALVLCIDIGTDLIPGISLAYEKPERNLMTKKPRNPQRHKLVNFKLIFFSLIQIGILQTVSGFLSYFYTMHHYGFPIRVLFFSSRKYFQSGAPDLIVDGIAYSAERQLEALAVAQTSFFISIIMTQIADACICKTRFLSFFQLRTVNLLQAFGITLGMAIGIMFSYVPVFNDILGTGPINVKDWSLTLPFTVFIFCQDEVRKLLIRRFPKSRFAKIFAW